MVARHHCRMLRELDIGTSPGRLEDLSGLTGTISVASRSKWLLRGGPYTGHCKVWSRRNCNQSITSAMASRGFGRETSWPAVAAGSIGACRFGQSSLRGMTRVRSTGSCPRVGNEYFGTREWGRCDRCGDGGIGIGISALVVLSELLRGSMVDGGEENAGGDMCP